MKPERRIERLIAFAGLEPLLARLPDPLRMRVARKRFGDIIDRLAALRHGTRDNYSLREMERLNCFFIHVPKAAGLSVAESLFGNYAAGHIRLQVVLSLYGARRLDGMFKFAFVRDPETRLVSAFRFLRAGGINAADRAFGEGRLARFADLDDFVRHGLRTSDVLRQVHFQPQTHFLRDPRTGEVGVDFIGRFETLDRDFETVCRRLGLERDLAWRNPTRSDRDRGTSLDDESRAIIREVYAEDYRKLGYPAAPDDPGVGVSPV